MVKETMSGMAAFGIPLYLFAMVFIPTNANYIIIDTWGQEYCRSSYCGIMDADGWNKCCDRYRKCCAYAEYSNGRSKDPFAYEVETASPPTTTTTTTTTPPTTTSSPTTTEQTTEYLGGPLGELPPPPPGLLLHGGHPLASLRLPSLPQIKSVSEDPIDSAWNSPKRPSSNELTYKLRLEDQRRDDCRSKFCALMHVSQWYNCCSRYKTCCAYVNYHSYQDPFYFEKGPNDP